MYYAYYDITSLGATELLSVTPYDFTNLRATDNIWYGINYGNTKIMLYGNTNTFLDSAWVGVKLQYR